MAYINNLGQIRVGVRGWVAAQSGASVTDSDATAFVTAAGITDSTQISALNTLVTDLKTYGLWTKMKAIYPFVGGSAASHKFNLKDPRDLDAAYRLVFNGGWTHTSNGAKPNGTTGYADTKLNTNILSITNSSFSLYLRTVTFTNYTWLVDLGVFTSDYSGRYGTSYISQDGNSYFDLYNRTTIANTNLSAGFIQYSRTSSSLSKVYYKNTSINTNNNSVSTYSNPNNTIYLGALHLGSGLDSYSNREQAFISIGDGLTDTEASNFYISVQKFQTTLGRHVGTPYVSDPDAIAFLMAAGITDGTQAAAINTLVIRMKADGVWTKMKAIYPFVGGSAASHKFNLKDPRDLDAAFRLVFNGGGAHSSTGYIGNASNAFADTKLSPFTALINNNNHLSVYSNLANTDPNGEYSLVAGALNATYTERFDLLISYENTTSYATNTNGSTQISYPESNKLGMYIQTRTSSNIFKLFKNNSIIGTNTSVNTSQLPNFNLFLGAHNVGGTTRYAYRRIAFASIGDGLTDAEASNLYSAVQAFQTTLGRQTDIPLVSDTDAQAFLNAANITSFQQASAVNKLVVDLKAAGVWTKMKAIYPFVGGSAASHKWNLKDPRDLDAAFRLVFNGGWVHSITGVSPNGSNAYADTKLIPSTNGITTSNAHISFYSRNTNVNGLYPVDMGVDQPGTGLNLSQKMSSIDSISYHGRAFAQRIDGVDSNNISGLHMLSRISTTSLKYIRNNSLIQTITTIETGSVPTLPIFIGSLNNNGTPGLYSTRESGFASIGDGLTDTESTAFYNAVQTYQTSLGRHVATPVYNNGLVLNLDAGNANSYPGTGTTWFDLASGKNATLLNGPVYNSNNGGYLSLDGVNDRIDTTYTPGTFTNQTIIAWINKTNTQYCFILQKNSSPPFGFEIYPTTIYVAFGAFEAYVGYNTNGWHQVAYVYDGTQTGNSNRVKVYLNGVLQNLTFGSNPPSSITINDVMQVGWRPWASLYSAVGISTLQMYNTSLSATEILNNFNSTRGRFGL